MPRLILMRHAKSSWDDLSLEDHDRPLSRRGKASAKAMGEWLRAHAYEPDVVLSSTATRTRETYDRLRLTAAPVYVRSLYHAGAERILAELNRCTGETVLLLGHNPGIGDFASRITEIAPAHPRFASYPTCATLVAEVPGWSSLTWGSAVTLDFAIPRELLNET